MKLIIITILLTTISFAQSDNFLDKINDKNKDLYLKKLKKYKNDRSYTFAEKEALKVQREDIINSKVIIIAIKKGSILVELNSNDTFITSKEVIARAFQLEDYDGYRLLIGKDNKIKYKVRADVTSNLKTMLAMYEEPRSFDPIEKKIDFNLVDKELLFNYDLTLNLGLGKSSFLNEVTNANDHFSNIFSYELAILGKWKFPIQAGFLTKYETQSAQANSISYSFDSLLLGLSFELQDQDFYIKDFNIGLKLYTELVSRLNITGPDGSETINISKNALNLYFTKPFYEVFNGDLLWGVNYSRQWIKAKASTALYSVGSRSNTNNVFALSLTYRGAWR